MTWLNPQAIVDGTMMLGAFYVMLPAGQSAFFIGGVCAASGLWFHGLAAAVFTFKHCFCGKALGVINKICGIVIIFYGCRLLMAFFQKI